MAAVFMTRMMLKDDGYFNNNDDDRVTDGMVSSTPATTLACATRLSLFSFKHTHTRHVDTTENSTSTLLFTTTTTLLMQTIHVQCFQWQAASCDQILHGLGQVDRSPSLPNPQNSIHGTRPLKQSNPSDNAITRDTFVYRFIHPICVTYNMPYVPSTSSWLLFARTYPIQPQARWECSFGVIPSIISTRYAISLSQWWWSW